MTLSSKSKQTLQNSLHFFSIWEIFGHFCPLVCTIQKQAKLTSVASNIVSRKHFSFLLAVVVDRRSEFFIIILNNYFFFTL